MMGDRAHGVVGDAGGIGAADPGWIGEERIEAAVAALSGRNKVRASQIEGSCAGFRTGGNVHRRDRCILHHNGREQSIGWHLPAVWTGNSYQKSVETKGIR